MTTKNHSPELEERIHNEQISLLYSGSIYRPLLHLISLTIFLLIIIKHVNNYYAYTWALLLIGLNVFRFFDTLKIKNKLNEIKSFKEIHYRYVCCAALLGAVYATGFVFFFNDLPLINQVYLMTLVAIMTPAGLVSFASDKLSFNFYLYSLVTPVIIRVFIEGQIEYFNIGVCAILFVIIVRMLFLWNYNVLYEAIGLKFENEKLYTDLQTVNARLIKLSVVDELTQIANRRNLDENLEKEWLRSRRMSKPLSMLMIDIDHFKKYNDEFGHIQGDECLKLVADFLKNNLNRSGDFVARYGGEEFCILMPETNLDGAVKFAETIHSGIRDLKIPNPGSEVSKYITISIGVASVVPGRNESHMDLLYTSDKALYNAKNEGRNIIRTKDVLEKNPKPQLVV